MKRPGNAAVKASMIFAHALSAGMAEAGATVVVDAD